jgi:hypothetical protein
VEAVASDDDIGVDALSASVGVGKRDEGVVGVDVVRNDIRGVVVCRSTGVFAGVHQVFGDFGLAVDRDRSPDQLDEVQVAALPRPLQVDAAVFYGFGGEAVTDSGLFEQVNGAGFEDAGSDTSCDVVGALALDEDRVDTVDSEQMRQQ